MTRLLGERLKARQLKEFRSTLLDAFDLNRFDAMLLFHLGRQREHLALDADLETIIRRVIERAEMESWTAELLLAARSAQPDSVALFTFAQQFGLATATAELEHKIAESGEPVDTVPWRSRRAERENQVCRVEVHSGYPPGYGTGFLLGPNVVMTCYHVMEKVISKKRMPPERVKLRFDYKKMAILRLLEKREKRYLLG